MSILEDMRAQAQVISKESGIDVTVTLDNPEEGHESRYVIWIQGQRASEPRHGLETSRILDGMEALAGYVLA